MSSRSARWLSSSWVPLRSLLALLGSLTPSMANISRGLRLPEFIVALLLLAYIMGVSVTRSAALGLLG